MTSPRESQNRRPDPDPLACLLWIDETLCQKSLDYIAQYRQEWDENKGMFKENLYMILQAMPPMFTGERP